ncbi:hypothetical protein AG1IA_05010 [Rhizoctonia solani AG-1 IA]|uniref:DNA2/NAM7 helicase-like C-terminal domain-containing protein n=1 Tax=Thanatephorus cucumeris (strain AG1-IA) TaxID=983506 RepID=L8WW02_THACA|nr:hypothetical protein AG1IA_05010 [Rhizoctonia solani AG-1 IA]
MSAGLAIQCNVRGFSVRTPRGLNLLGFSATLWVVGGGQDKRYIQSRALAGEFKTHGYIILTKICPDRLPIPIAKFISQEVYKNRLLEDTKHEVKTPTEAMLFVDTPKGEELKEERGTSFMNHEEAKLVVQIVELYYNKVDKKTGKPYDFQIITPYEAQRKMVHDMLNGCMLITGIASAEITTQGNEADYIITTLTKTTFSSFLSSINRLNVLLTRCKKGLVVVSQKEFITRTGGLLRGLWWKYESDDIWKDADDVSKGYVNLPGSPAPVKRPVEGEDEVRRFVFEMFLPADGGYKEPETESDSE